MRHLDWDGCFNARDLGGLRAAGGRQTRWRAVVRSDAAVRLTEAGWSAAYAYGIRTVIDLRNDDELGPDTAPRPTDVDTVHLPLDGLDDTEFWGYWGNGLHGTPLYFGPFLERFPRRTAGVIAAIAHARQGGVLVHCATGRDRTGIISMLLLALAGVAPEDIAADHALSTARLRPAFPAWGMLDQEPMIDKILTEHGTTGRAAVLATLASLDVEAYLRGGGLTTDDVSAVRLRLLGD
jgi:protein-tyrosine phosphatase